jgi:hypothetical protein
MRIYTASSEETLRARKLLADWAGEGFITKAEYERLEKETVSELRTTNIFLRVILFLFTLICVLAAAGLFYVASRPSEQSFGVFLLMFAVVCYAAGEIAISQFRLYRYGIEEALAACSVGFLCLGMLLAFFSSGPYSARPSQSESLVLIAGAIFSLWIWHRFGLGYAFLAAMVFALFLPGYWTSSHPAQHVSVALLYAMGLICVMAARSSHRSDYLDHDYSLAEALLWLGIYLAINLQLSSLDARIEWWGFGHAASQFPRSFYWATWVLIWLMPPIVLVRGIREKDRFVIAVGAIVAIMTFLTNKPYLGWPRHTSDPMLLGILLTAVALFIRRWLAHGADGIRHGFTAARLSGKDKQWLNTGSVVLGLVTPQAVTPGPQTRAAEVHFDGGASGGGGASGEF